MSNFNFFFGNFWESRVTQNFCYFLIKKLCYILWLLILFYTKCTVFLTAFSSTDADNSQDSRRRKLTVPFYLLPFLPAQEHWGTYLLQSCIWGVRLVFLTATHVITSNEIRTHNHLVGKQTLCGSFRRAVSLVEHLQSEKISIIKTKKKKIKWLFHIWLVFDAWGG